MAKLVFGMNQSLDGYVDHLELRPGPALSRQGPLTMAEILTT